MNRLVFYRDDDSNEFVSIVTDQEYYNEILKADVVGDVDLEILDYDFVLWPRNRPLSQDF